MKYQLTAVLALVIVCCTGCKDSSNSSANGGAIAIVDLDRVFRSMGWTEEMRHSMQQAQAQVSEDARNVGKPLRSAVDAKCIDLARVHHLTPAQSEQLKNARQAADLAKLGITPQEIEELTAVLTALRDENYKLQTRVNQLLQGHQQAIVLAYQQAVEPAVRRVALANNRAVVMNPGPYLLYNDPSADMTDKVVDDLQHSSQLKVDLPPAPSLGLEPLTQPSPTTGPAQPAPTTQP